MQLAPGIGAVEVSPLTINTGSTLDLTNNKIIVDYSGASPAAAIRTELINGYAGSSWTGMGIFSSTAAANTAGTTTLGYVDTGTQVIIKYTWVGDANLDGMVTHPDLSAISPTGTTWATGDFNYDGVVNADDYALYMLGAADSGGRQYLDNIAGAERLHFSIGVHRRFISAHDAAVDKLQNPRIFVRRSIRMCVSIRSGRISQFTDETQENIGFCNIIILKFSSIVLLSVQ